MSIPRAQLSKPFVKLLQNSLLHPLFHQAIRVRAVIPHGICTHRLWTTRRRVHITSPKTTPITHHKKVLQACRRARSHYLEAQPDNSPRRTARTLSLTNSTTTRKHHRRRQTLSHTTTRLAPAPQTANCTTLAPSTQYKRVSVLRLPSVPPRAAVPKVTLLRPSFHQGTIIIARCPPIPCRRFKAQQDASKISLGRALTQ